MCTDIRTGAKYYESTRQSCDKSYMLGTVKSNIQTHLVEKLRWREELRLFRDVDERNGDGIFRGRGRGCNDKSIIDVPLKRYLSRRYEDNEMNNRYTRWRSSI